MVKAVQMAWQSCRRVSVSIGVLKIQTEPPKRRLFYPRVDWWPYPPQGRRCTYNVTLGRVRVTIVAVGKRWVFRILIVCCLAFVTGHAMLMRRIFYCHLWPVWFYHIFPHYLINDTIFGRKCNWTQNVFFDLLYSFCPEHFSFWGKLSETLSQMHIGLHVQYRSLLSHFNKSLFFWTDSPPREKVQISVGAELFRADRQDRHSAAVII